MMNRKKRMQGTFAAIVMATASLVASPAWAQPDPPAEDPKNPYLYCSYTPEGGWFCCRIYDPCGTQIYYDSAIDDRRPEEEPSEAPKG
jgi:hypothetical protein